MNVIRCTGNIWSTIDEPNSLLLVTTNSILKSDGSLVMGAGIAKQAALRYKTLPHLFGERIKRQRAENTIYGLIIGEAKKLGAFQTKVHWKQPSELHLITTSCKMLAQWIEKHPNYTVNMPLPGCGYGGLKPEEVWPILDHFLSKQVKVWTYE